MDAYSEASDNAPVAGFRKMIENHVYAIDEPDGRIEDDTKSLEKRMYFATLFKAKGLGATNVWWITKDLDPEGRADGLTPVKRNMYYVAVTRTIQELTFLDRRPFV